MSCFDVFIFNNQPAIPTFVMFVFAQEAWESKKVYFVKGTYDVRVITHKYKEKQSK